MNLQVIRTIAAAILFFAPVVRLAEAKPIKATAADVQTLANFPALQRLSAKSEGKIIRNFLRDVSSEYRAAGYGAFAQALPKANSLVALFGNPEAVEDSGTLRKAHATLRHLQNALANNPHIALPETVGEKIPDYFGIATAFNQNASRALKNLAIGKNVANFLRKKLTPAEITNIGDSQFTFTGTAASLNTSSTVMFTSIGSTINGSTLTIGGSNTSTGGSLTVHAWGSESSGTVGMLTPPTLAAVTGYRWIAFPPSEEIPNDWTTIKSTITLTYEIIAGTLTLPGGNPTGAGSGGIFNPGQ